MNLWTIFSEKTIYINIKKFKKRVGFFTYVMKPNRVGKMGIPGNEVLEDATQKQSNNNEWKENRLESHTPSVPSLH